MNERAHKLTGVEVGRLVLQDLARVHQNSREGRQERTMTTGEKANLVNALTDPSEVADYNDFRYYHEFLSRLAITFNVYQQSADARFWQLFCALDNLRLAERENAHILTLLPRIMTRGQYDQARSLFNPSGGEGFGRGVAVIETAGFPDDTYKVGKNGQFQYPVPTWRQPYLAERFLEPDSEFSLLLLSYRATLKEVLVVKTAVDLIARFLQVPELSDLVGEVDLAPAETLNRMMGEIPSLICRRELFAGERSEEELRAGLAGLFRPIDVKKLKPSARAKAEARRVLDFSVARGQAEKMYKILRREDD